MTYNLTNTLFLVTFCLIVFFSEFICPASFLGIFSAILVTLEGNQTPQLWYIVTIIKPI